MKLTHFTLSLLTGTLAAWSFGAPSAQAQTTFIKANNNNPLDAASSYTANLGVPGVNDTILFDSNTTTGTNFGAGSGISVNGLVLAADLGNSFTIFNNSGGNITLGSGGITNNSPNRFIALNGSAGTLVTLSANQTWDAGAASINMSRNLITQGYTLNFTGGATSGSTLGANLGGGTFGDSNTTIGVNGLTVTGQLALAGANTYNKLTISGNGTLSGNTFGNFGEASSFGDGGGNLTILLGADTSSGTFRYTGNSTTSNRTFNRRNATTAGLENGVIEVATAGQTLTITGNLGNEVNRAVDSGWRFGGAGNLVLAGVINDNGDATGKTFITKNGTGRLTLTATNTYQGSTTVSEGVLLVDGSTAAGSAVSVSSSAVFGGNGTVNGNLTLANGALFAFDPGDTLDLIGNLALDPSFGVNSLRNTSGTSIDWASIAQGTYTLMNTTFAFNSENISNFGQANQATGLAGGKSAYFQQGSPTSSLQLVVVPEPAAVLLAAVGAALSGVALRRHCRS
jgi:autotransporter-associated beta strand protein